MPQAAIIALVMVVYTLKSSGIYKLGTIYLKPRKIYPNNERKIFL